MKSYILSLLFLIFCPSFLFSQEEASTNQIDWASFLSQHDLVWNKIVPDYYAGAIMGNGLLGNNIYKEGDAYKFHIGRVDVTEGRTPRNMTQYRSLYHDARLPIGYFLMKPTGKILTEQMRLGLWDANTTGSITTDNGKIAFRNYVHATKDIIVLETETEDGEDSFVWEWKPLKAISPRYIFGYDDYPQDYIENPNPDVKVYPDGDYNFSVQNLVGGKSYCVAWHETKGEGRTRRFLITVSLEDSEALSVEKAKTTIEDAKRENALSLYVSHKQWWHNYYPSSFASFGDAKMESFYWIQQYKFACLTRPDKYLIDLQGPWAMDNTPWPAIWLNLNVQLAYSPLFTANRTELSKPLWKSLNDNLQYLCDNVAVDEWKNDAIVIGRNSGYRLYSPLDIDMKDKKLYEVGNLTWILYYYYQYCTYLQNEDELLNKFYPLLKKSIAYYEHIKEKREDGKYHLPETASPEYGTAKDCNYDLSLLRWGLETLLDINTNYRLNDSKVNDWADFKENLTLYPVDADKGFMIGENVNLTSSHRHYSHLLMIYPLYLVNWEQAENRQLIERSISHWQSMPDYLQGYSFTGSASMYATAGDGQKAVSQLQKLLDRYVQPNTLYKETGPVIETPLAGAASLQELYLQSWGGKIRIFPAVPDNWKQASFIDFRAEGAFLVSAIRDNGKTVFIQIKSEKGGLCRLQTNIDINNFRVEKNGTEEVDYLIVDEAKGLIGINTRAGDVIRITDKSQRSIMSHAVTHSQAEWNSYGINTMQE